MDSVDRFLGHINQVLPPNKIIGWAVNVESTDQDKPIIVVSLAGKIIGTGRCDIFREDLKKFGTGDYAFEIQCAEDIPPSCILSGDLKVDLQVNETKIGSLLFDQNTKNICAIMEIGRLIENLPVQNEIAMDIAMHHASPHISHDAANVVKSSFTLLRNGAKKLTNFSPYEPGSISALSFKTGIISNDRAAVLGQDGNLFLIAGSNNVAELFETPYNTEKADKFAGKWLKLVKDRIDFTANLGITFLQIIIPEKITMARELLDGHMSIPSANLSSFERQASTSLEKKHYLSGIACLNKIPFGEAFRKVDSHLVPFASFTIFREICAKFDINIVENIPFNIPITVAGDLAERFFGYELYEVCMTAKPPKFSSGLKLVSTTNPRRAYMGKKYVFKNSLAPIAKKVILFGNSFFDNPGFQGSASYWMSLWFQEYHFVFSPDMDLNYIAAEKPDIVICQTIERFMEMLPGS